MNQVTKLSKAVAKAVESDRFVFTVSSDAVDRMGDVIRQVWSNIKDINKRGLPALFGHEHLNIVGRWNNFRVTKQGRNTVTKADLELLPRGTSELVDLAWALCERAWVDCSIGLRPLEYEYMDGGEGIEMLKNDLLEVSLVAVPANPDALPDPIAKTAKALIVAKSGEAKCASSAACQLGLAEKSHASDVKPTNPDTSTSPRYKKMNLSDRIQHKEDQIVAYRDQITELTQDEDFDDEVAVKLEELNDRVERAQKDLELLKRSEASLAARAEAQAPKAAPVPRIEARANRPKGHALFAAAASVLKAHATRQNAVEVAKAEYRDDPEVEIVTRAAVAAADANTTAAWAQNLTQQSYGEFVELLRDRSVYPNIPGMRFQFDGSRIVNLPIGAGRGNLAGGFVAEGGAIKVAAGSISTTTMQPHRLKVISAFTKELAERSTPAIQSVITDSILGDTAEAIDSAFLGSTARSAGTNPAGLQDTTETGAANVNAVTNAATGAGGSTLAEIISDTSGVLSRVYAARMSRGVWVMNPKQVLALADKADGTTGERLFRDEINRGVFRGYTIVESANVTDGIVLFVAEGAMAFGSEGAPMFDVSDQATLHMESSPSTPLTGSGTPNTVVHPIQSMYQTDTVALKMSLGLDWKVLRQGGVQVLTAATGW